MLEELLLHGVKDREGRKRFGKINREKEGGTRGT